MSATDIVQIVSVVLATLIGYALGVYHTRRAVHDVLDQIKRDKP